MAEAKRGIPFREKAGIAAYGIICLALFICLRFPYENFRGYLEQTLSDKTGKAVDLGPIHPHFPFGIRVEGMSVDGVKCVKDLTMRPHILPLALGKFGMDIDALFTSGSLSCSFDKPMGSLKTSVNAKITMDNFDSSLIHTLFGTTMQPRGTVTGTIDLEGPDPSLKAMGGSASFVWSNGFIPLSDSQLPMDGLKFTNMTMSSHIERGMLTLDKMEMKGEMAGSMKGSIWMMDPAGRSRLNLTGELMLAQGLSPAASGPGQGAMRFSLRGSLDRPRFRIIGAR